MDSGETAAKQKGWPMEARGLLSRILLTQVVSSLVAAGFNPSLMEEMRWAAEDVERGLQREPFNWERQFKPSRNWVSSAL